MKGIFHTTLLAASLLAHPTWAGEWRQLTPSGFMLKDTQDTGYNLALNLRTDTREMRANFVVGNHPLCVNDTNGPEGLLGPYAVNGQMVNFQGICLKGIMWLIPSSKAGDAWLLKAVKQGQSVKLEIGPSEIRVFDTRGVNDVISALERAQKAL